MERFDKETESCWCVCVSVSRKGQWRTKSVTHDLHGLEMVPVLFATCFVKTNTYIPTQTHSVPLCSSFSGYVVKDNKHYKTNHWNRLKETLNGSLLLQVMPYLSSVFLHFPCSLMHEVKLNTHISVASHLEPQMLSNWSEKRCDGVRQRRVVLAVGEGEGEGRGKCMDLASQFRWHVYVVGQRWPPVSSGLWNQHTDTTPIGQVTQLERDKEGRKGRLRGMDSWGDKGMGLGTDDCIFTEKRRKQNKRSWAKRRAGEIQTRKAMLLKVYSVLLYPEHSSIQYALNRWPQSHAYHYKWGCLGLAAVAHQVSVFCLITHTLFEAVWI